MNDKEKETTLVLAKYKEQVLELYILHHTIEEFLEYLSELRDEDWTINESFVFLRETLYTVSLILSFLPHSPIQNSVKMFSYSNLNTLGRLTYENFVTIYYLLDHDEELDGIKKIIWEHHVDYKRLEMLEIFGSKNPEVEKLRMSILNRKPIIENNQHIQSIENNEFRKKLVNGETDRLFNRRKIIEKFGWNFNNLESSYKHFTQFSHSTSFASNQLQMDHAPSNVILELFQTSVGVINGMVALILIRFHQTFNFRISTTVFGIFSFWENFFKKDTQID